MVQWVHPAIVITPDQPQTLKQIWRNFIDPILMLITMSAGSADGVASIDVALDGIDANDWPHVAVIDPRRAREPTSQQHPSDHLVRFEDVVGSLSEKLTRWFNLMKNASGAIQEFFGTHFSDAMYLEDSFVRTVRSMEQFHAQMIGGRILPAASYKRMKSRIRGVLENEDERNLIEKRLAHGNEPFQARRLSELIDREGGILKDYLLTYPNFVEQVVKQRNFLTHGGNPIPQARWRMHWARVSLEALMYSLILAELGFESDLRSRMLQRWNRWNYVTSIENPWRAEALGIEVSSDDE